MINDWSSSIQCLVSFCVIAWQFVFGVDLQVICWHFMLTFHSNACCLFSLLMIIILGSLVCTSVVAEQTLWFCGDLVCMKDGKLCFNCMQTFQSFMWTTCNQHFFTFFGFMRFGSTYVSPCHHVRSPYAGQAPPHALWELPCYKIAVLITWMQSTILTR